MTPTEQDLERARQAILELHVDDFDQEANAAAIASLIAQVCYETLEEMKEHFVREAQSRVKKCEEAVDDMDSVDYLGQADAFYAAALHVISAQREIRNLKQEDKE